MCPVGTTETLRAIIEAGRSGKRLDELTAARIIKLAAEAVHAAQQKAGAGKAVGPFAPEQTIDVMSLRYDRRTIARARDERFATLRVGANLPSRAVIRARLVFPFSSPEARCYHD